MFNQIPKCASRCLSKDPTLDHEVGALTKGLIALYLGGRDSTISISSFRTSTKCFQSNISLNSLQAIYETNIRFEQCLLFVLNFKLNGLMHLRSVQKEEWSRRGRANVAFISFAAATMSHICIWTFTTSTINTLTLAYYRGIRIIVKW